MADATIKIIVEAITSAAEKSLKGLQKTVADTGKEGEKSGKSFDSMKAGLAALAVGAGAVGTALVAMKKLWDFSKEGAAIAQTKESFDRLVTSIGAGPGVLEELRRASRGTVDDMTLMSGVLTLNAGASENLSRALIMAAPQLMEIAKAANKLNPTLGDTAHMYDSLSLGIKRNSPLILDNLGIVVKIGEANETYAKKIGKTVEQLTAEDKQMALLEATLAAGDRLIQQVGGDTESMADAFARSEVELKNATDTMKTQLVPVMSEVADAFADGLLMALDFAAVQQQVSNSALEGATSYEEYVNSLIAYAEEAGMLRGIEEEWIERLIAVKLGTAESTAGIDRLGEALGLMSQEEFEAAQAMLAYADEMDAWMVVALQSKAAQDEVTQSWMAGSEEMSKGAQRLAELASQQEGVKGTSGQLAAALRDLEQAEISANQAAADFDASLDLLHAGIDGAVGETLTDYRQTLEDLKGQLDDGTLSTNDYKAAVDEAADSVRDETNAIIYNIAEKMILDALEKDLIKDINDSGTAYDEASEALWALAGNLGLVDDETIELQRATMGAVDAFIQGKSTASELGGQLGDLSGRIVDAAGKGENLTDTIIGFAKRWEINLDHNFPDAGRQADEVNNKIQGIKGKSVRVEVKWHVPPMPVQHGGPVLGGMPLLVGERGPELFVPERSGVIIPNHMLNATVAEGSPIRAAAEGAGSAANTAQAFANIGIAMMTGLSYGIKTNTGVAEQAMTDASNRMRYPWDSSEHYWPALGQNMMNNLAGGISDNTGVPEWEMQKMTERVLGIAWDATGNYYQIGKEIGDNTAAGIADSANTVAAAIADVMHQAQVIAAGEVAAAAGEGYSAPGSPWGSGESSWGDIVPIAPAPAPAPPQAVFGSSGPTYNLTINTSASPESALSDFAIMQALAGV